MRTLGFGAVGRAGNASEPDWLELRREDDGVGVGRGEGRLDDDVGVGAREDDGVGAGVPHAVVAALLRDAARDEEGDAEESGGNGLLEDAAEEGRAPLLPTAERDDWAVDDFKRSTRLPPAPLPFTVLGDMPGSSPPGPGSAG